jgi:hypothetical protein
MGATYPLNIGASVTMALVGGVVQGVVQLVPPGVEKWHITRATVITSQASTVTPIPTASLYTPSISDQNMIDSTYTGCRDSTDLDIWLEKGQPIICQWLDGIAGTIATLSLFGTRELY